MSYLLGATVATVRSGEPGVLPNVRDDDSALAADIVTNTADIATNVTNIATNATNITGNATDISDLELQIQRPIMDNVIIIRQGFGSVALNLGSTDAGAIWDLTVGAGIEYQKNASWGNFSGLSTGLWTVGLWSGTETFNGIVYDKVYRMEITGGAVPVALNGTYTIGIYDTAGAAFVATRVVAANNVPFAMVKKIIDFDTASGNTVYRIHIYGTPVFANFFNYDDTLIELKRIYRRQ
jgi:hypothetical protein